MIDPGHGGDETGTRGAGGTLEKDVTLDVARRLKASLEGRLGIRVLLTRDDDRLVPLDERASIANNNKADLFISLHANASPRPETRGAEVFYLSLDGFGEAARKLAEPPQGTVVPALGGGSRDIELIAWEMAQARHLGGVGRVRRPRRGGAAPPRRDERRARSSRRRSACWRRPTCRRCWSRWPSSATPQQEAQLGGDEFKNQIAQSLYDAIVRYRARIETPPARRRP